MANQGPWSPLKHSLFRAMWIASVASNIGTWMHTVGASWLMTTLAASPLLVALVQTATTLPVFLLGLPAGVMADLVDRRKLLIFTQSWMLAVAALLGILVIVGGIGPWWLLTLTFALGAGSAMNGPAWAAAIPELVPREELPAAVALNSVGFNIARAVGPALGGIVIAIAGSGVAFLLNAASFFGVIFFLYRWKRPHFEHVATGRVRDALVAGLRYVRGAPQVRSILIRTGAFSVAASSLPALLPILARPHGATGYGLLLGFFGLGALAGAAVLPRVRTRFSVDGLVACDILLFAAMTFAAGRVQTFSLLCLVLFTAGTAWIGILACLNIAAQTMCPSFLRARALSMYLLVLQGGMALGSATWGALATRLGVPAALSCSAAALAVGLLAVRRHRLTSQQLKLTPSVVRD